MRSDRNTNGVTTQKSTTPKKTRPITPEDLVRISDKLVEAHKRIAAAIAAGELRCSECGAIHPLAGDVKAVEQYLFTAGWPVCCEQTMGFYPPKDYLARIAGAA